MAKCSKCGKHGLTLKLTSGGLCIECAEEALRLVQQKYDELNASISPEMQELLSLRNAIAQAQEKIRDQERQIAEADRQIEEKKNRLAGVQKEIISAEDIIEMESFSMYRPKYALTNAEEYKERLDAIRSQQKDMIKAKTAVIASTNWTVNNSISEGKKNGQRYHQAVFALLQQ